MSYAEPAERSAYFKEWWSSDKGKEYLEASREKRRQQHKKYRQTERGKAMYRARMQRNRLKYPEKWRARKALQDAVKAGKVTKLPCEVCGEAKTSAHHSDYLQPLSVQ